MNCIVIFTDTAKADLRQIAISLAELTKDKNLSLRFIKELQEKTRTLEQFPESGAFPRDRVLKSHGYRFIAHGDYLLFYLYEKEDNKIYIMAIFNGKQDYMRVMKKFL